MHEGALQSCNWPAPKIYLAVHWFQDSSSHVYILCDSNLSFAIRADTPLICCSLFTLPCGLPDSDTQSENTMKTSFHQFISTHLSAECRVNLAAALGSVFRASGFSVARLRFFDLNRKSHINEKKTVLRHIFLFHVHADMTQRNLLQVPPAFTPTKQIPNQLLTHFLSVYCFYFDHHENKEKCHKLKSINFFWCPLDAVRRRLLQTQHSEYTVIYCRGHLKSCQPYDTYSMTLCS